MSENRKGIINSITTTTKVIGLIILITETLFIAAIIKLPNTQIIWALIACLVILVIGLIVIMKIESFPELPVIEKKEEYSKIIEVNNNIEFYDEIAEKYDERNTDELLITHRYVICEIESYIKNNDLEFYNILDLGAGTGRLIAHQFFNTEKIKWSYLDSSSKMIAQFNKNLEDTKLKRNVKKGDINNCYSLFRDETYNIIILSCVLTSLPQLPDFSMICKLLSNNGILIVTDIDPSYTNNHPYYSFKYNGQSIALKTNPVNPIDVCDGLISSGLKLIFSKPIKKQNGVNYSYNLLIKK